MQPAARSQIQHELVLAQMELANAEALASREVTEVDAHFAIVVDAYHRNIDDEITSLLKEYSGLDTCGVIFRISSLKSTISCTKRRIRKLENQLGRLPVTLDSCPEDPLRLEQQIGKLTDSSEALSARIANLDNKCAGIRQQIAEKIKKEQGLFELLNPGIPSIEVVQKLFCPITKKPLHNAIRLPNGTHVNADGLGLQVDDGKIKLLDTPENTYENWDRESLWKQSGDDYFYWGVSLKDFKTILPRYLSSVRPDYKTRELAEGFLEKCSTSDNFDRKSFQFQWVYDAVVGGVYERPQLLKCGHAQSIRFVQSREPCGHCRKPCNSYLIKPHGLLTAFIEEYQRVGQEEILREKQKILNKRIEKKLFNNENNEEEIRAVHREVCIRLIEIKHIGSFASQEELERIRKEIFELQEQLNSCKPELEFLKNEHCQVKDKIVPLEKSLRKIRRHKKNCEDKDKLERDLKEARLKLMSATSELSTLEVQHAKNSECLKKITSLKNIRDYHYTERFSALFRSILKEGVVSTEEIQRMQYKLKEDRKIAVKTAAKRCAHLTSQLKLSQRRRNGCR